MQSTPTLRETDPHDIFLIEPDVVLAARANQASPDPVHDALSRLAHRSAPPEPDKAPAVSAEASTPAVDTTFRAAAADTTKVPPEPSAFGRRAKKTFVAFMFALCSAVAAATWSHHGEAAKQIIANWVPSFVLASLSPAATPRPAEQPDSSPVQAATADQAPAPSAQPLDGAAPTQAAASAESTPSVQTPSVQSMARDLATMGQQIEQLKASIEQLKTVQAQTSRELARTADLAKTAEQNLRPRIAALPPRPAPIRKPKPAFPPAQAATASTLPPLPSAAHLAPPQPMPQATVESDGGPVVRPPMPLH